MKTLKNTISKKIAWCCVLLIALYFLLKEISLSSQFLAAGGSVRDLVLEFPLFTALCYISLQVVQIIIFFIPGNVVGFIGGFFFGPILSTIYTIIGAVLGGIFCFLFVRRFGKKHLVDYFKKKDSWALNALTTSDKKSTSDLKKMVFLLFVLPMTPKDLLGFMAGLTSLTLKDFILVSTLGRIPGIVFSTFYGHSLHALTLKQWFNLSIPVVILLGITLVISNRYVRQLKEIHIKK